VGSLPRLWALVSPDLATYSTEELQGVIDRARAFVERRDELREAGRKQSLYFEPWVDRQASFAARCAAQLAGPRVKKRTKYVIARSKSS
jgi:hypothetical protein